MVKGEGVWGEGGGVHGRGVHAETATKAGGMHPTGMHSCLKSFPLMDPGGFCYFVFLREDTEATGTCFGLLIVLP